MHWPQVAILTLYAINFGTCLVKYGERKTDSYDSIDMVWGPGLVLWLMYMGGFFG